MDYTIEDNNTQPTADLAQNHLLEWVVGSGVECDSFTLNK